MRNLSFRLKILLAMMLLVVGVTSATMLITQARVQAAYRELFREQFESQAYFFSRLQEARLGALKSFSLTYVRAVRFISLMGEYKSDPSEEVAQRLYQTAQDQLNLQGVDPALVAFRFLDEKGAILPPPTNSGPVGISQTDTAKGTLKLALQASELQQIAYLEAVNSNAVPFVQEAIFTKVIDQGEQLGGLILAFPLPDVSELSKRAGGKGALLLNSHLYGGALTDDERGPILAALNQQLSMRQGLPEPARIVLNGVPHLLFYRLLNSGSAFAPAYHVTLFSMANTLRQQRDLRGQVLSFGLLALAGALGISLLLSHGLTAPITELVAGAGQISQGNYGVQVRVRSSDEIGRLSAAFNDMAAGLALKEKYRSVLDMVADKDIAEELLQGKITLGGETRRVSVLFCDIRGFTALTEKMSPPEVIQMLNEHFTPLTRVVYEHHGVVDKYVGDLIMAIFGAPKTFGSDARNAAACALRMIEARERMNASSKYTITVGIGVASGEAVAGRMGSADRLNYTVLGERVNLASRLCSRAGRMEVVIDSTTRQEVGAAAVVEDLEPLTLKGFAQPVQAFKLRAITPA